MADTATALQGELSALVHEMQELQKALEDANALVASSTAKMHQVEAQATAIVTAAANAVAHHETDLAALVKSAHTVADQLKADIDHGSQTVIAEAAAVTAAAEKTYAAAEAAKAGAGHLAETAGQHAHELTAALQQFGEVVKQIESALTSRIGTLGQDVGRGVSEITQLEQTWAHFAEETAHALTDALQQTTGEIEQKFLAPLEEGTKQFLDVSKQIEDTVLSHPITALADQLKNTILSEAQHELDAVAQQVQKLMDDAVHSLTEAGGGGDAVTKELRAVFHELEPVWNALTDALRAVQSIWDTVKSAVSIL